MKKKLFSLIMVLIMVLTMLPAGVITASAESTKYSVTIQITGEGTVSADPMSAAEDEYVTVTMTAAQGWFVKQMLVTAEDNIAITTINYKNASFEQDVDGFTMPGQNVTLKVTFAKPEDFSEEPDDPTPHEPGDECYISFDANGGVGSMPVPVIPCGDSYTLPDCDYTKEDREFYKWEISGTEYDKGDSIVITDDTTVKAIWKYTSDDLIGIDNSNDTSTTEIVGVLKLKDLRTGETSEHPFTEGTAFSEFTDPYNDDVNAMIEDAKYWLNNRLLSYSNAQNEVLSVSDPSISETTDNRSFTQYDNGGYDSFGDYFDKAIVTEGDYGRSWQISVTLEAEYTSVPMSYIHVLSTDGGYVDFWCDDYNGDYEQPYAVPEGAVVNLIAVPEQGYEFKGWYKGDVNASSYDEMFTDELITTDNPYVFESYDYPYVCAKFEYTGKVWPQGEQIQVWVADGGKASVAYEPSVQGHPYIKSKDGKNYVSIGEVVQLWKGDEITVNAKPDEGYVFKGWYHVRIEWGPGDVLPKYEGKVISTDTSFTYKPGVTVIDGDTEPLRYICAVFEKENLELGDANGDGVINIDDATEIQRIQAGLNPLDSRHLLAADTNQNGIIDIDDSTIIQRFLAEFMDHIPGE